MVSLQTMLFLTRIRVKNGLLATFCRAAYEHQPFEPNASSLLEFFSSSGWDNSESQYRVADGGLQQRNCNKIDHYKTHFLHSAVFGLFSKQSAWPLLARCESSLLVLVGGCSYYWLYSRPGSRTSTMAVGMKTA